MLYYEVSLNGNVYYLNRLHDGNNTIVQFDPPLQGDSLDAIRAVVLQQCQNINGYENITEADLGIDPINFE